MGTRQRLGRTITGLFERRKNEKNPAREGTTRGVKPAR
jgi:hypothetical protein